MRMHRVLCFNPGRLFRFAIACVALVCTPTWAEEVIIGWAGPEQQPHARALKQGVELAIAQANERGIVVQGRRLRFRLLTANDNGNPNVAPFAARSLAVGEAVAVIGHYTTETTLAGARIYAENGIPLLAVFAPSPLLTQQGYKNVFQLTGTITDAAAYMISAIVQEDGGKRLALAYNGSLMGTAVADAAEQEIRRRGMPLAGRLSISARTSDFNALLNMVRDSKPGFLYFAGLQEQSLALSQRLESAHLNPRLLLSGGAFNPDFYETAGGYPEGTSLMMHLRPRSQMRGFAQFEKSYMALFQMPVMPYAANAYDAAAMVIEAIRRGNSSKPAAISATLHAMAYEGVSGRIAFDSEGRLRDPVFTLYEVRQQQWRAARSFP